MLRFINAPSTHRFLSHHRVASRRDFLRIGALGGTGLGLTQLLHLKAIASNEPNYLKDRSVIFVFMHGGPSQYETFDPKMDAPTSIRSMTGEIPTSIPGITFGSTFEKLAQRAHLFNIVRSFVTGDGNHDIKPILSDRTLKANMGSIYSRIAGPTRTATAMPTNVTLFPRAVREQAGPAIKNFGDFESAGPLGAAYSPFVPGDGANLQQDLRLNIPQARLEDRKQLLSQLDTLKRLADASPSIAGTTALQQQAFETLVSGVAQAFDLSQEDPKLIEGYDTEKLANIDRIDKKWNNHPHYADHGASIGKLLLLARRLCERGVGFVTVTTSFVWDMHADINNATMREGMGYVGTPFDHALAALIDDIEARGLRDKILVVCCGEMGRTPKINAAGGRDHWGEIAPLLLYGGGLPQGQIVGQSNREGSAPASDPIKIPDLIATIMDSMLNLDQVRLQRGLPRSVVDAASQGTPIRW
jgi:uncharacterized protein (DUF1501 family)